MTRYVNPTPQIQDGDGKPIVGAKKYFFETGTSTLKTVYSDADLSLPIDNPVDADEYGRFPDIFLDGIYREVQHDDKGVLQWEKDPIGELPTGQAQLWSVSETYNIPEIVYASDDEYYRSLTDSNIGNNPTTSPAAWEVIKFIQVWNTNVTYVLNQHVYGSDGTLYFSRLVSNFGNDPTTNPDDWGSVAGNVPIVTAGSATVYTAIFGITAYKTNRVYEARIHTDNTGAATINFDSLGAKDIKLIDGTDPVAGQITGIILFWYDGTNMVPVLLQPIGIKPSFSVHRNTVDQNNITSIDKIEWTTEDFDTNNDFDNSTNYRFTPTIAGKYLLTVGVKWASIISGDGLFLYIYKNGSIDKRSYENSGTITATNSISYVVDANGSSDFFEVFAQNLNRDTAAIRGDREDTYFTGCKID